LPDAGRLRCDFISDANALNPAPGVKKKLGDKNKHQTKKDDGHFWVALFAFLCFPHLVR
jgi:hypothetical protein